MNMKTVTVPAAVLQDLVFNATILAAQAGGPMAEAVDRQCERLQRALDTIGDTDAIYDRPPTGDVNLDPSEIGSPFQVTGGSIASRDGNVTYLRFAERG